ncbi:hypothetical protein J7E73_08230 [Paenibacillus albidus]|uniref:hypothetical protein n=1 Tax=Paenibacillus albidus TaxID=2041023 RepID=UPI001BE64C52|nr:hypothetical protein [Paenibacillus albidus]MBT2289119.1 hypothetical protein [Paenibacillus albidus]
MIMAKNCAFIFSFFMGLLIFSNQSYAKQDYLQPSNESTDVAYVSENVVVLIDYTRACMQTMKID